MSIPQVVPGTSPAWMDAAACTDSDANFFPEQGESAAAAKMVCRDCPVRVACLQWALDTGEQHGVFGGLTAYDRRGLDPARAVVQCPECLKVFRNARGMSVHRSSYCGVPIVHGKHVTYGRGCRCEDCRAAHALYEQGRRRLRAAS